MSKRLATGLAAAGGVEAFYAVRFGQEIVQSQLVDPVVDGVLWPMSIAGSVVAVLVGSGIMSVVSLAIEEFGGQGIASGGDASWHGAGGMCGAVAGFAVTMQQIAVFATVIPLSAPSLTPLMSCALVATPLALSYWKVWTGLEPDLLQHSADDDYEYDAETIRDKTTRLGNDDDQPPEPATRTQPTEKESSDGQIPTQSTLELSDAELEYDWQNSTGVTFGDVGGMDEEIAELQTSVIAPLKCLQKADGLGVRVSNVILHGPPGTGKSHLAKALASELDVPAVLLSGADIQSKWINESASKVNDLFSEAEQVAANKGGALIFVDELDSVLRQRGSGGSSHSEDMKVVNEFLTPLENTDSNDIVFIGATNRLQELDDAGTRPGRIDTKIKVGKPDTETREAILHTQLRDRYHSLPDELISNIAEETKGDVAADLTQLVDAAATEALQRKDDTIRPRDISTVMSRRN